MDELTHPFVSLNQQAAVSFLTSTVTQSRADSEAHSQQQVS